MFFRIRTVRKPKQFLVHLMYYLLLLYYNIIHNIFVDWFRDDGMALAAPGAYVSPRRPAGLPAPAPVKVVATIPDATTTATIVMHQRIIEDCFNVE